ncbi:MFS transporter [Fibrella sp. HMF5335]|uniref:MFS transporter n=1 Tax=Fibrella rubiginis TaxID=2817060 RepID=A0A939GJB4_9BACT|nr:MFS transporter [Fibrella rubiginis]MBO0938848.1 MFS transporter [Fibrella rubiginis]
MDPSLSAVPVRSPRFPLVLSQNRPLRFVTFFYLYVMQGVPAGFATTALANYIADAGISSDRVGTFVAMQGLPWSFQFIWGPFIDKYQSSPMGRRRPWVLGAQLLAVVASLGMLTISDPLSNVYLLGLTFLIHSTVASVQDASVDAMAISTIPDQERGRINAFMRGGFLAGTALGAAGLAVVLKLHGFHVAVLVQSAFLLTLTVITFFIREQPQHTLLPVGRQLVTTRQEQHEHSLRWLFSELFRGLFARESLRWFLPILLLYSCQNAFIRAYNIHLVQQLNWDPTELSQLTGSYGILIVVAILLLGGWAADRYGAKRLLPWIMGMNFLILLTFSLAAPYWTDHRVASAVAVVWNMLDPSLSMMAIPILMALCRRDVEGSQFTTYMAFVNLSDIIGAFVSGHAQQYITAPTIGLCTAAAAGLGLVWILITTRKTAQAA